MVDDLDVYRTANLLVKQHGSEAPIFAGMRADALMAEGDMEGRGVWLRILELIKGCCQSKLEYSAGTLDSNFVTIDFPRFFEPGPGGSAAISGIQKCCFDNAPRMDGTRRFRRRRGLSD